MDTMGNGGVGGVPSSEITPAELAWEEPSQSVEWLYLNME